MNNWTFKPRACSWNWPAPDRVESFYPNKIKTVSIQFASRVITNEALALNITKSSPLPPGPVSYATQNSSLMDQWGIFSCCTQNLTTTKNDPEWMGSRNIDAPDEGNGFGYFHGLSRPLPKSNSGPSVPAHSSSTRSANYYSKGKAGNIDANMSDLAPDSTAGALDSMKYSTALPLRLSVRSIRVVRKWKKAAREAT